MNCGKIGCFKRCRDIFDPVKQKAMFQSSYFVKWDFDF